MTITEKWSPDSWRNKPSKQLPEYPDQKKLDEILNILKERPPLVSAGECLNLKGELAKAARGEAFVLQGGDCAESFDEYSTDKIMDTFNVLVQMNLALMYGSGGKPIVKIGRIAGQYAKPRSKPTETVNGEELPSYKGDIINGTDFNEKSRTPDPKRMKRAYNHSAVTLNFLRSLSNGDYYSLKDVHQWTKVAFQKAPLIEKYTTILEGIDRSLEFFQSTGIDTNRMNKVDFYTSHEALLLPYEEALTRQDSKTGNWFDVSAHMLWIGDRTRQPDHGHVEFLRGVENPVGIKCGPTMTSEELTALLDTLNPENEEGRIMLISRMGHDKVHEYLPILIDTVEAGGYKVLWSCDPMHGNTHTASTDVKTRDFENIKKEVEGFFDIHRSKGTIAGGIHLEMTGHDVTECTGGVHNITDNDLSKKYNTVCDPRLNANQSLELAFLIADELKKV